MTRIGVIAALLAMLFSAKLAADDSVFAPRTCNEANVCCARWTIELHRPNGTVWGAIEKPTLSQATAELERVTKSEHEYCAFLNLSYPCSEMSYDNASAPRCAGGASAPDVCSAETATKIEALTKAAMTRNTRVSAFASATDALRVRAEAAIGRSIKMPLSTFAGAAVGYEDALAKLQRLRSALRELCVPTPAPDEQQLWGTAFPRGGVRDLELRKRDVASEIERVQGSLNSPVAWTGPGEPLTLDKPSRVLVRGGGPAQIVLSSSSPLVDGAVLPAGTYIAAGAFVDGDRGVLRHVTLSKGWQGAPDAFVLTLTVAGEQRTLVLVPIDDPDGDGIWSDVDKCPKQKGSLPDGCPHDSDGDGFADHVDGCPTTAGPVNGCPAPQVVAQPSAGGDVGSCAEFERQYALKDAGRETTCQRDFPGSRCRVYESAALDRKIPGYLGTVGYPWTDGNGVRQELTGRYVDICVR